MSTEKQQQDATQARLEAARAVIPTEIHEAHRLSSEHRDAVLESQVCGCFYCLEVFKPTDIKRWIDNNNTAVCPRCGIDSVLPGNSGFPVNRNFLTQMQFHWFKS